MLRFRREGEDYKLIFELFGAGNAVLVQGEEVLGAWRSTAERPLRPHEPYEFPRSGKRDLLKLRETDLQAMLATEEPIWRVLFKLEGLSPRLARELAIRAGLEPERPAEALTLEEQAQLWEAIRWLQGTIQEGRWEPQLYFHKEKPVDVAPFPLESYAGQGLQGEPRASLSEALDEFLAISTVEDTAEQLRGELMEAVRSRLERTEHARERVLQDLEKAADYERYRRQADLILANLNELQHGQEHVELRDPATGEAVQVRLDPRLSPAENAQRLYSRYKKLKRGLEKLQARLIELEEELMRLHELTERLEAADAEELEGLAAELRAQGLLPASEELELKQERGQERAGPREFLIKGYRVLVGRSGKENDRLVRMADGEDLWLHVRGMPGAHVIIRTKGRRGPVPPEVILKAAELAAYYSKGRGASKVEVSYTPVKYLRKPRGGKPGAVLLQHEEGTVLVRPRLPEGVAE